MSPKPKRRKKAISAKRRTLTFKIVVEGQPMLVSYKPSWLKTGYAHFEFRSPHKPARRILISETGYKSLFASSNDVRQARTPQAFARAHVLAVLDGRRPRSGDPRQLALFG
jgi:hypothetical protein